MHTTQPTSTNNSSGTGFNPAFLSTPITVPTLNTEQQADTLLIDGSPTIIYTHFSLALNSSRKLAYWVGWNIDGTAMQRLSRTGINFTKDPRIPDEYQAGNDLYANNRLDRGHLARRADLT